MIQKRRVLAASCGLLVLAGCASTPKNTSHPENTSPKNLTSVVRANYSITGGYVPDISGNQSVYTRSNMRRIDTTSKFDSFVMRWANSDVSDIFRMDQNLLWVLDNDERSYRECPLSGCLALPLFPTKVADNEDEEEEYVSYADRDCKVTLASNDFTVEETGETREIGGLDASEYVVSWQTDLQDEQGRTDTNLLQFVFWTAVPTEEMNKAWKVHSEATDNYMDAVGDDGILVRLLGRDGFKSVGSFVGDIEKTDERAYQEWTTKLAQIEGYPLSIKMEWFQRHETCPEGKAAKSTDVDLSKGLDGLKSAATGVLGNFVNRKKDELIAQWQKEPRVRYVYEVTSISEELIPDSTFVTPEGYKLADRKPTTHSSPSTW